MELLKVRQPFTLFQEEKYQMLELNQRLESYLGRVKLLEEENKLLREEIHTLKKNREPSGQHKAQEEALNQTRRMKEKAWQEKDRVEMEVENLIEDMEMVNFQRQKEKTAQTEAQRKLAEGKKELEEEQRAQIWLKEKVAQLEKDLLLQMQVHQENMETLHASLKQTKQVLMAPHPIQSTSIPDLEQEFSHRAAQAWKEATSNYQKQVERLEESLSQAKTNMAKIHQQKRENQHQLQHVAKELESTKMKREMLEKHVVQQREEQRQELQHLQAQVDALEVEKETLGQEIDSLMMDRQNLMQVKMSLGLEVATYRALLDGEGLRFNKPSKTHPSILLDGPSKPTGTHPTSKNTAASSHSSSIVSTSHRSISSSQTLLTNASPQRTPTRASVKDSRVNISEEKNIPAEMAVNHLWPGNDVEDLSLTSIPPHTVGDSVTAEPRSKEDSKQDHIEIQESDSKQPQICEQPSSLSKTPAGVSEEGKDEDTEVSEEMVQISNAPEIDWEKNKTWAEDEKDEIDESLENYSESQMIGNHQSNPMDRRPAQWTEGDKPLTSSQINENINMLTSLMQEQESVDSFSCKEESNKDLIKVDIQDNVRNISEGMTELIDSVIEWDRQEDCEEQNEMKVMNPDAEVEEQSDVEKNETDHEIVTERENEETEVIQKDTDGSFLQKGRQTIDCSKNIDHEESLEDAVPPAKTCCQTLNEDHALPEEGEAEEENQDDEEDSPNISASCRTDPGECDSYTQENTLADTRPLIHYKSDEETDMHVRASHFGAGETSDSEDEREKIDGGRWGESVSKRFNTMEDLSEEPDMDVIGEMITEEMVQTEEMLDGNGEQMIPQNGYDGAGGHEDLVVDVVDRESLRNYLEENQREESEDDVSDEDHGLTFCEQKENPQLSKESQMYHIQQPSQDETINSYDSQENVNMTFVDHPSSFPDVPFPETSQDVQAQRSYEVSSTMFQNSTTIKEETVETFEKVQNISIHTNITNSIYLESEINSQPESHMPNSDQQECNSLEDESQNPNPLAAASANDQTITLGAQCSNDSFSIADSVPTNEAKQAFSTDFMENSLEYHKAAQIDNWENFTISTSMLASAEIKYTNMHGDSSQLSSEHKTENLESSNRISDVAENILGEFEQHLKNTKESFSTEESNTIDIFQRDNPENEKLQGKDKESEIHSFFSASLKKDFWREEKMEMAATYDPTETETIHSDQGMVSGEEWRDLGIMATANGNPKEDMEILKGQSQKNLQHKDEQSEQTEMIQSDESVNDGDSWSSGDE